VYKNHATLYVIQAMPHHLQAIAAPDSSPLFANGAGGGGAAGARAVGRTFSHLVEPGVVRPLAPEAVASVLRRAAFAPSPRGDSLDGFRHHEAVVRVVTQEPTLTNCARASPTTVSSEGVSIFARACVLVTSKAVPNYPLSA
jgi:hypothetical protein